MGAGFRPAGFNHLRAVLNLSCVPPDTVQMRGYKSGEIQIPSLPPKKSPCLDTSEEEPLAFYSSLINADGGKTGSPSSGLLT